MVKKCASRLYMALIFAFLYLPIVVLIILSFNRSNTRVNWKGFTLDWYVRCFQNENIMSAFATTLEITFIAAILATIIGTLAALGISAMKKRDQYSALKCRYCNGNFHDASIRPFYPSGICDGTDRTCDF